MRAATNDIDQWARHHGGPPAKVLDFKFGSEPPPCYVKRDHPLFALLAKLEVGHSLDVTMNDPAARCQVYKYRVQHDRDMRFIVRALRPKWVRIWRLK